MIEIDEVDQKIIRILQRDGRTTNVDIARRVGVTEGTVRKRIEKLTGRGLIRVAAIVDPAVVGRPVHTHIGLQVDMGALDRVIARLVSWEQVLSVHYVTGEYDLVLEAAFADNAGLMRFLTDEIGRLPGIRKSSTSHVLRVVKSICEWTLPEKVQFEVLVVDDDPDFVEFCRMVLDGEGYRVVNASSGSEALNRMRIVKPDLVVLDVMMQDLLDGLHASHVMRADQELAQIPILMVSSIADSQYAGLFPTDEHVPVDCFLCKPISPAKLISEVRRLKPNSRPS